LTVAKLGREQLYALGGLCALVLVCALIIIIALQLRADALDNLARQRDQLASLEARTRSAADRRRQTQVRSAPELAFLDAPSSGLATAQFQAYLSQLVTDQHAVLVSTGVRPSDRDDKSDAIRLQASLNATLPALQALLYRLEAGTPYVFVDALSMQPGASSDRAAADPVLKVNLTLHAFWHRRTT
jgi:general secretion pathway protein M